MTFMLNNAAGRLSQTGRDDGSTSRDGYPRLSIIVQFFNRLPNIKPIAEALRLLNDVEIIVCDDGSIDGSHQEWLKHLVRPDDVLIHSNDLHEIRSYDRAASLARGDVICFLQDDDIPPGNADWVETALALFSRHRTLGILGGFRGYEFSAEPSSPSPVAEIAQRVERPSYLEPDLGVPFMFVQAVNLAPLFIRHETYRQTGYDDRFSKPAESGILFDQEICLHAWLKGWQVGLCETAFARRVGGRGTLIYSKESRERNFAANLELLGRAYGGDFVSIKQQADGLNDTLLRKLSA